MADPLSLWRGFLARPNDDRIKTLGIAGLTAVVSAFVVSTAAVLLDPVQQAHLAAERAARMEAMLDRLPGLRDLMAETGVDALETRMVDLASGAFVPGPAPEDFDLRAAAQDPALSVALPPGTDLAGIGRRPVMAPVHLLQKDGALMLVVLPVLGQGYQAPIAALLALEPDLNTVAALTITAQGDTPGLGARIEEPAWQALWPGKQIADATGEIVISVVRGGAAGPFQVDGISGATRTSLGVESMLRFWMGPEGWGPFLDRLETEGL
jgi:Na+-transporting NADH:ubiquinone oxidoreductase subunit C